MNASLYYVLLPINPLTLAVGRLSNIHWAEFYAINYIWPLVC
jgi:hypothetical protein